MISAAVGTFNEYTNGTMQKLPRNYSYFRKIRKLVVRRLAQSLLNLLTNAL